MSSSTRLTIRSRSHTSSSSKFDSQVDKDALYTNSTANLGAKKDSLQSTAITDRRGSLISSQFVMINDKLQLLYDEIGISEDERRTREQNLYEVVSLALENHVSNVTEEKEKLYNLCLSLKQEIAKMIIALENTSEVQQIFSDPTVLGEIRLPLLECSNQLQSQHDMLQQLYLQRHDRACELLAKLRKFVNAMDGVEISPDFLTASFDNISLTDANIATLEHQVTRLSQEFDSRVLTVQEDATEIVTLWAQLGTSQHQIDRNILSNYKEKPELLGLSNQILLHMREQRSSLEHERDLRRDRLASLKSEVKHLWNKLSEDEVHIRSFDRSNRGIALSVISAYETELSRLNEKKHDFIHVFIEDARQTLQSLWDSLYFSEEEMLEFTPAWTDIFTDASLAAHESEISRLEGLLKERKPIIALIDAYRNIHNDAAELESLQQDSSRLLARGTGRRDPSRLLREEQMRKRIAKMKPKITAELMNALTNWESVNDRPFMVNGERYLDVLRDEEMTARAVKTKRTPSRNAITKDAANLSVRKGENPVSRTPFSSKRPNIKSKLNSENRPKQPNFWKESKDAMGTTKMKKVLVKNNEDGISTLSKGTPGLTYLQRSTSAESSYSSASPLKARSQGRAPLRAISTSSIHNLIHPDLAPKNLRTNAKTPQAPTQSEVRGQTVGLQTPKVQFRRLPIRKDNSEQGNAQFECENISESLHTTPSIGNLVSGYSFPTEMQCNVQKISLPNGHSNEINYISETPVVIPEPREQTELPDYELSQAEESEFVDDYDEEYDYQTVTITAKNASETKSSTGEYIQEATPSSTMDTDIATAISNRKSDSPASEDSNIPPFTALISRDGNDFMTGSKPIFPPLQALDHTPLLPPIQFLMCELPTQSSRDTSISDTPTDMYMNEMSFISPHNLDLGNSATNSLE
ncbi:microtubule associated protein-domain-containing protein [Lipomyces oligophaga]|uniref:microtubule associated protein-domain-containing protein n=1 Tax=Lipomyces oligophaga TaxID=45792 RepID=UPI0034CF5B57